jgi:hypothetical protein
MSATTLRPPIPVDTALGHARPRIGRLVTVELRKMVNTRAGFWLQIAMVASPPSWLSPAASSATVAITPSPASSTSGCS